MRLLSFLFCMCGVQTQERLPAEYITLVQQGHQAQQRGDHGTAMRAYQQANHAHPEIPDAFVLLSRLMRAHGRLSEAVDLLQRAIGSKGQQFKSKKEQVRIQ